MNAVSEWVSVGELGAAFEGESNILSQTEDLAGRQLTLNFEDGDAQTLDFVTQDRMTSSEHIDRGDIPYSATKLREGIYFIDFLPVAGEARSVSLVVDVEAGIFTAVDGRLPTSSESRRPLLERIAAGDELTGVTAEFRHGTVNRPAGAEMDRHMPTDDLVNKRVEYIYSPTERYEHIYLNPKFYTWHCLDGIEKGLADTDRCHYYRIADDLYLFVWREKIVPTLGVVLLDLQAMKTTGKILGHEGYDLSGVTNFPVGARARILNVTPRDQVGGD